MMLSDKELIDYTIKHSTDPEKVRLATVMERTTGAIIDDLEDAGMDPTFCTFRSEWGGDYHPGRYIIHLEDEIRIRDEEILQLRRELEERKTLKVSELIAELRQEVRTEQFTAQEARNQQYRAEQERNDMRDKMKVWRALTTDTTV